MNGPFSNEYWQATCTELETLVGMVDWDVFDRKDDMIIVIISTWTFKLKPCPDGIIKSSKARFCDLGDMQLGGIHLFDNYVPVVQWTTIRLMLILELLLQLK